MFYRENGQFKSSYSADLALFPIAQDRWAMLALMAICFVAVPMLALGRDHEARCRPCSTRRS